MYNTHAHQYSPLNLLTYLLCHVNMIDAHPMRIQFNSLRMRIKSASQAHHNKLHVKAPKVCTGLPAVSQKICHYLCSPTPGQHFTPRLLCLHEGALHKSLKCLSINHGLAGTDCSILSLNARYQPRVCWLQYALLKSCEGQSVDWLHKAQIHALHSAIRGLSKSMLCA